jgi:hypothetical protein
MPGKGNSLASPPYFCKVSLDAGGTGDTAPGELGKYVEGTSGKDRSDQTKAYHTKILSFTFVRLGSACQARITFPACTGIGVVGALPDAIVSRSSPITPECGISIVGALLDAIALRSSLVTPGCTGIVNIVGALPDAIVSRSSPITGTRSRNRTLELIPPALGALSVFLRRCVSNNHP